MISPVYLDSNILIAHQVRGHIHHERAKHLIDMVWRNQQLCIVSSLTMDEFFYGIVFVLQSVEQKKLAAPFRTYATSIKEALSSILSWQYLRLVPCVHTADNLLAVTDLIQSENLRPRDAFHIQTMKQHHVSHIATFDRDFDHLSPTHGIHIVKDIPV